MSKLTLKALRINAGFSQDDVAKKLGLSTKTISKWENGITFPTPKYIDPICELYGVSYDNINFLPKGSL